MTRYFAKDPTALGLSVSAMVWRGDEILLMRRSDNGFWGLPGGFVEVGESVADAARREVAEETGWTVELGRLIGVYSDPATQVVDYSLPESLPDSLPEATPDSPPDRRTDDREGERPGRVKRQQATSPVILPPRLTGGSARRARGSRASAA